MTKATAEKLAETQEKILNEIKDIRVNLLRLNSLERFGIIAKKGKIFAKQNGLTSSNLNKEDEEIWKDIEPAARKARGEVFRRTYPNLYAKTEGRNK